VLSGRPIVLDAEAIDVLQSHPWPGNVRELVNLARRLVLFAADGRADAELLRRMLDANPFGARIATAPTDVAALTTDGDPETEVTLDDLERRYIERLLARHRNVTRVAEILGINRRTLQRKLRGYGLDFGPA
jgi:DNA-binding NtrC family response regulator